LFPRKSDGNDTGDKLIIGVNDNGDKLSPMSLLPASDTGDKALSRIFIDFMTPAIINRRLVTTLAMLYRR
jgi:hypothetical protein